MDKCLPPWSPTMQLPLVLPMTPSSKNDPKLWICASFGSVIEWDKANFIYTGAREKTIWPTILLNIILGSTISVCAQYTYTPLILIDMLPWMTLLAEHLQCEGVLIQHWHAPDQASHACPSGHCHAQLLLSRDRKVAHNACTYRIMHIARYSYTHNLSRTRFAPHC